MSRVLKRAFLLLELIARSERPLGLMELVEMTGDDKSTLLRALSTLEDQDLIVRDVHTKKYRKGPSLMFLAAIAMSHADLADLARPHLDSLRDSTEETVSLHLRRGEERVCIAGSASPHVVQRRLMLGEPVPLYLGPSGQVILANLPDRERDSVLVAAAEQGADLEAIAASLETARERGYLITVSNRTSGVGAISTPVFDSLGVVGSLTIAGPEERWTPDHMEEFAEQLLGAARTISNANGDIA